jgi:D-amino-acid dehydrogenase
VVAAGHGMLGLSLGPVTGMLVAEMIAGRETSLDVGRLAVGRFS